MRRAVAFLLVMSALSLSSGRAVVAADLPTKAPAYTPAPSYDWTGFYVGGNMGYAWGTTINTFLAATPSYPAGFVSLDKPSGFFGGGQIGANYQLNYLVIGLEGSADWTSIKASGTDPSPLIANVLSTNFGYIDSLFTAAARVGLAWHSLFIYGKGGAAWAEVHGNSSLFSGSALVVQSQASEHIDAGWLVGAGSEWMLDKKWSVKAEYDYIDLGPRSVSNLITFDTNPALIGTYGVPVNHSWKLNAFSTGLNYHF